MLYFKRTDGGYSQVDPEQTPITAARYAEMYKQVSESEFNAHVPDDRPQYE